MDALTAEGLGLLQKEAFNVEAERPCAGLEQPSQVHKQAGQAEKCAGKNSYGISSCKFDSRLS